MNGRPLPTVSNGQPHNHEFKTMRLFDELTRIKQSSALMEVKRVFWVTLVCAFACVAGAQTNLPPQTEPPAAPPPSPSQGAPGATAPPSATQNTSTNQLAHEVAVTDQPTETRQTRSLTLEECIKLALEHNLDIQIQASSTQIDKYLLNAVYGAYEPIFSLNATKNYNDYPSFPGIDPSTGLPYLSSIGESDIYTPGITGVLPTGLQYSLTGSLARNSTLANSPDRYLPPVWTSDSPGPGISLRQPLLRNFWIDNTRLQIQLNKATLKISLAALKLQMMNSVTAVKSAYFNLLYARDNVEANATAYKLAEQLVSENLKREEVGALAPLDEKQSEAQAASSLAAMHVAEQQLVVQENTLKNLLTDDYAKWADVTLLPAEKLEAVPESLNLQESFRRAVLQRPDLIEAKLRVESQNVTLKYDLNQIFPELDVLGSYGRNANQDTVYDALGEIQQGNHSYYSYGASVTVPLGGNYTARSTYKSGKATLKQLLLSLKQTEQNILVAVDNDVGSVRSTLQQVYATRDARVYAQDALDAEKKKLENGKSTSFIVLQLISNLTTARVNELQALANYNIAVAQLALDEGDTLDENRIDVNVK
jgi:outer membrane protein